MLTRTVPRWPAWLAVGLLAGFILAALAGLPRVSAFAPAEGGLVSSRAAIRLTFNRPMNAASVQTAWRLAPDHPGTVTWEGSTLVFTPLAPWPAQTITVTLAGGRSALGLPLVGQRTWSFQPSGLRLAYLTGQPANLWAVALTAGAAPQALTREPNGLYDYDISADGARLVYAALRPDGGADLRQAPVDGGPAQDLLACPGEACLSPVWSPDGQRVAYERHRLQSGVAGGTTSTEARVRLFTPANGQDAAVGDPGNPARFPRWTPDGRLSYFDVTRQALVVYDPLSGAQTYIPDTSGDVGSWSPDGQKLVFAEIYFPPEPTPDPANPNAEHIEKFYSNLLEVTVASNATRNLSGAGVVEDASPVYSPSGDWLVFARRGLGPDQWSPGRQIWRMRADGTQPQALTNEPFFNHSALRWSPDGRALAYMRFDASNPAAPAEVWLMEADGANARRLAAGAYLPEWLP